MSIQTFELRPTQLHNKEKRHYNNFRRSTPEKQRTTKIEVRKALYTIPFLYLSGVFSGIAIMLLA